MKVLSKITVPAKVPTPVEVTNPTKDLDPGLFDSTLPCLVLPVTGASAAYALPPGTRRVSCIIPGSAQGWVAFGDANVVATATDSHHLWKNDERREFDVANATFIAYLDAGASMSVSCFG